MRNGVEGRGGSEGEEGRGGREGSGSYTTIFAAGIYVKDSFTAVCVM